MHASESAGNRRFDALRALDALIGRRLRDALVERLGGNGIGESRSRASLIDSRLGSLGLESAQDSGELGSLGLIEVELEREKSERTPHAKAAGPHIVVAAIAGMMSMGSSVPAPRARTVLSPFVGPAEPAIGSGRAAFISTRGVSARVPPSKHSRMHFSRLLAGAHRAQRASG